MVVMRSGLVEGHVIIAVLNLAATTNNGVREQAIHIDMTSTEVSSVGDMREAQSCTGGLPFCSPENMRWLSKFMDAVPEEAKQAQQRRNKEPDRICNCNFRTGAGCKGSFRIAGDVSQKIRAGNSRWNASSGFGELFFLHVINGIRLAEHLCLTPFVDFDPTRSDAYFDVAHGNPWENYFLPISKANSDPATNKTTTIFDREFTSWDAAWATSDWAFNCPMKAAKHAAQGDQDRLDCMHQRRWWIGSEDSSPGLAKAQQIVHKYFHLRPEVLTRVNKEWAGIFGESDGQPTLGVHIRKTNAGARSASTHAALTLVQRWLLSNPSGRIFLATDSAMVIESVATQWPTELVAKVKYREGVSRGTDKQPIFGHHASKGKYEEGLDVLLDILFLSRCNFFIRSKSSWFSEAVLLLNPKLRLQSVLINPVKESSGVDRCVGTVAYCGPGSMKWLPRLVDSSRQDMDLARRRREEPRKSSCPCDFITGARCEGILHITGGVSNKTRRWSSSFGMLFFLHIVNGIRSAKHRCLAPFVDLKPARSYAYYDPVRGNPWEYYFHEVKPKEAPQVFYEFTEWDVVWAETDWDWECPMSAALQNADAAGLDSKWALECVRRPEWAIKQIPGTPGLTEVERIISDFFSLRPEVKAALKQERLRLFGDHEHVPVLGVHMGGTDSGARRTINHDLVPFFREWLSAHPTGQIYLATDSIEVVKSALPQWPADIVGKLKYRIGVGHGGGTDLIFGQHAQKGKYEQGLDALLDILILARCDFFVCSATSSFSEAAMLLNPRLRLQSAVLGMSDKSTPLVSHDTWEQESPYFLVFLAAGLLVSSQFAVFGMRALGGTDADRTQSRWWTAFVVTGFAMYSSSMLITNKVAIGHFAFPTSLLALQCLFTAAAVRAAASQGYIEMELLTEASVRRTWPVALGFLLLMYCSVRVLQVSNVEMMVVVRCFTGLLISVLDFAFLGRELPSLWSVGALILVAFGTLGYLLCESEFRMDSYFWAAAWLGMFLFDQIFIKHMLGVAPASTWTWVYQMNALAGCMALAVAVVYEGFPQQCFLSGFHGSMVTSVTALVLSCGTGLGMSVFSFATREALTATSFTVVGNGCKIFTLLVNCVIWSKHTTPKGLCAVMLGLMGSFLYKPAPLREVKSQKSVNGQ